jgi:surface protein
MKKHYQVPETDISNMEGQGLFCASGNENFDKGPEYGKDLFEMASPFKLFSIALLATVLLSACNFENVVPNEHKTYKGIIEQCETRTYLFPEGDVLQVFWRNGDFITITDGTNSAVYAAGYGGSRVTSFDYVSGKDPTGVPVAYYPSTIANNTLPAVQDFEEGTILNQIPMYGTIVDDEIVFKNLCGIVIFRVSVPANEQTFKSLTVTADKGLSGPFTVVDNAAVISGDASVSVVSELPVPVTSKPVEFFMSIPAGEYSKFEIKAITTDGKTQTLKAKSAITVERSKYTVISLEFDDLVASTAGVATLPSGPDFATALKKLNNPSADATAVDESIKKIVFQTNSGVIAGEVISDLESKEPVYLIWDAGTATATVSTPGTEFVLPADASYMFSNLAVLESIENIQSLNTSATTDMSYMFSAANCDTTCLNTLDLSTFNTANVTTMKSMFHHSCALTSVNVKGWDTGNVETMNSMFCRTSALESIDLSGWNNASCEDFTSMFDFAKSAKSIILTDFKTDKATTMLYMFNHCESLETLDVSSFNTENVTDFANMFWCNFKLTSITGLKNFDTANCTRFRSMFNRCDALAEIDCSSFDVTSGTNLQYMFYKAMGVQKLDISSFDISGVNASVVAYMMPKLQNIREINFGDSFIPKNPPAVPDGFTMYYADTEDESMACQNPTRTVDVYCSVDVANYLVTTDMHYPHNGWHYVSGTVDRTHQPITINLIDWKTKQPINITWPANERYPL